MHRKRSPGWSAKPCTQLIADKVTLYDVRFQRCAGVLVPEPGTFGLTGLGLVVLSLLGAGVRRKARF